MTAGQTLLLADIILVVHFAIALFITWSLPVIWVGHWLKWRFVRSPWFRFTHLGLMGFVLVETLMGKLCPLTIWEYTLRRATEDAGTSEAPAFIPFWVDKLLFMDLSEQTFTIIYATFFAAVVATFYFVPIRKIRWRKEKYS